MKDKQAAAAQPAQECRDHARIAARGEITLRLKDGDTVTPIRGELLNVSAEGFRLKHQYKNLSVGQELLAAYGGGEVTVRVIWTTPLTIEYIESGFAIVPERGALPRWLLVGLMAVLMGFPVLQPKALVAQEQGEGQQQARKVRTKVQPSYPVLAKRMHLRGTVKIEVTVTPQGTVKSTQTLGGNPVFVEAALDAVKQWRWEPGPKETTEVISFRFEDSSGGD